MRFFSTFVCLFLILFQLTQTSSTQVAQLLKNLFILRKIEAPSCSRLTSVSENDLFYSNVCVWECVCVCVRSARLL